jgi:tetratricopeptide (TPR) repeat protein
MYNNRIDDLLNNEHINQTRQNAERHQLAQASQPVRSFSLHIRIEHPRRVALVIFAAVFFIALLTPSVIFAQSDRPSLASNNGSNGNAGDDIWVGLYLIEAEQYDMAIDVFTDILTENPEMASVFAARGIAYFYMQEYELAISDSAAALDLEPEYSTPYWTLGNIYYTQEIYENALSAYENYLELAIEYVDPVVEERVMVCQEIISAG